MADGLALDGLVIRAGERTLVGGLSLALAAGELVGLVGSSGSGKTLTCRAVLGMADLSPGVVAGRLAITCGSETARPYDGLPGGAGRRARDRAFAAVRGRLVGYLPQEASTALEPFRRVGLQVARAARAGGSSLPPEAWLARAGFAAEEAPRIARAWPHELSGGMAQRVVVAEALARGSRFLLADEPTTGLDAPVARRLLAELRALADGGRGVLLVTHDLRGLAAVADRVEVLEAGRIVETLGRAELAAGRASSALGRRLVAAAVPA